MIIPKIPFSDVMITLLWLPKSSIHKQLPSLNNLQKEFDDQVNVSTIVMKKIILCKFN